MANLGGAVSHAASGQDRAKLDEVFAPEQHAGALDPNTTIVLGARGAGKSFWAGVLGDDDLRTNVATAYPHLGLENLTVRLGYTGIQNDGSVSRAVLDARVPKGCEAQFASLFWRCVVLRAMIAARSNENPPSMLDLMKKYSDPEVWEQRCHDLDSEMGAADQKLVIIFDALDSLSEDWDRLRDLLDSLLEVSWSIRGYDSVRTKLFLRPDQLRDIGLRFVELPKLLAGSTTLRWSGANLYGMLYARLSTGANSKAFNGLLESLGLRPAPVGLRDLRRWVLGHSKANQEAVFVRLAGMYMGRSHKKGRTYDWPVNHLADGHGEVTPRSFITLMSAAAASSTSVTQVITAETIRNGLREASKLRVNQLSVEFQWIKRVLAPLSGLQVPCTVDMIEQRWDETATIEAVMAKAETGEFLPPIPPQVEGSLVRGLIERLVRIGVLVTRTDGRYDMPDLFRVAARLLKKGGVAPG